MTDGDARLERLQQAVEDAKTLTDLRLAEQKLAVYQSSLD